MSGGLGFDRARLDRLDRHFARYVEDGRLAGWQLAITRRGATAHLSSCGFRDREAGSPVADDTLWRVYSMTKPIASVAAMTLWEEGAFALTDPVSRWIPSFADVRVYHRGSVDDVVTVPAIEPVRVWHLLTHTSGLTAGFLRTSVVDALYRRAGYDMGSPEGTTLASLCDDLARLPLLFQPGTAWGYGASTDVLGRLVEIWSGQSLDAAIADRVTRPLGMADTVWHADDARANRLAALYVPDPVTGLAVRADAIGDRALSPPAVLSAGGGMLSTLPDYVRFTRMLAGGGELDGVRVLAPRTLRLMTANHLAADLRALSTGGFTNAVFDGVGFGLGFAVVVDPVKARTATSPGEHHWGGAAGTVFWVDPVEELTVVFMTQLLHLAGSHLVPSEAHPIRARLRQLVYSALVA
ncbi:serine hydrolase domain-containing protein [Saccharothrix coeruleofusca]|uniref:Serine hydrolase n=1 Tax=Saccharothrix coeruleofusca TaxID=33919 RepID=A0A918EH71_9PSEU|nr:serine hydrolase domain-containing protein [Saccharothrix coeruleofusca]GGP79292.1 serine hydrolase [Saccharothrix coeruleofusca]